MNDFLPTYLLCGWVEGKFTTIEPFLRINSDLGPVSRQKLMKTFSQKLPFFKLELASIVDWGKVFVKVRLFK